MKHDHIKEGVTDFGSVVFEDFWFGGFEGHVEEVDSDRGVEGVFFEEGEVLGDGFEYFSLFTVVYRLILKVLNMPTTIHLVIIIIIIPTLDKVFLEQDSLKIVILISREILMFAIGIVVIVELVVPASELVEEVNVLAVDDLEALAAGDLSEHLETAGIGGSVGLHYLEL